MICYSYKAEELVKFWRVYLRFRNYLQIFIEFLPLVTNFPINLIVENRI
jgi:hypothetical protein